MILNIADLREAARRRLPRGLFEYVDRGSEDEISLRENIAALQRVKLLPKVLQDVSRRDASIELFGQRLAMPLIVAPTGSAGTLWYQGEEAIARAADAAGIPFVLAGGSTLAMERAVRMIGKRTWFQLSMWQQIALSLEIMQRVREAGIEVLVATVDTPVAPNREYNARNAFVPPFRINPRNTLDVLAHPRWFLGVAVRYFLSGGLPQYQNMPGRMQEKITGVPRHLQVVSTTTWRDMAAVRKAWPGVLVVKGILSPQDARLAADHGADAVIVSNHGGRNLDSAPATIEMLPRVADAVGQRIAVLFDGGVRRGSDIVKALALGAKAVLAGRAPLYGVGAAGEAGVASALAILKHEMETTLAFVGCSRAGDLDRSSVVADSIR
jgi:isopentenyl diphosphate isomerase/L-lactate dehydrogenase-like FMN-dependent dehydrogenase